MYVGTDTPTQPLTTPSAWTSSRRRRWLRRAGAVVAAAVAVLGLIVWGWGWWAPPVYAPKSPVRIVGEPLDSAGHDARYRKVDKDGYLLHIAPANAPAAGGELLFFGALHSQDPQHPQIANLMRVWHEFKPTVALVEGRMGFFVGTAEQGIGVFGEGAAVYALAEDTGVPLYTLEPPLDIEIAALEECGDRTQVAMFRVLSGYISARRGGPVSDFKMGRLLSKRAGPITDAFPNIAAFDAYFAAQFPNRPEWRDLPEEAMWPGKSDTLLHRMATRSNLARDEHFLRAMLDLVNRGERVLAIAGRSHTINLEPVLWESLQPASRGGLSSPRPWE
jgi:hypothetical protein